MKSYSQCGEDLILQFLFRHLGIQTPSYLDIGAHHPTAISNTQLFYEAGSRGVNIEPDPLLHARFPRMRPRDVNLNIGVGADAGTLDFYVMDPATLSTFSQTMMQGYVGDRGHRLARTERIEVKTFSQVCDEHFGGRAPDLVSLDIEGLDLEVLRSIDFERYRPKALCVETSSYSGHLLTNEKDPAYDLLMSEADYFKYADTYLNSVYVDARLRPRRA